MKFALIADRKPAAANLKLFLWLHPEWWSVTLCGLAWAGLLLDGWRNPMLGGQHGMSLAEEVLSWMLMVAAMMLPLVIEHVRVTAIGSLWARRDRAIAGFLAGYFAPWLALGALVAGLQSGSWAHTYAAAAVGFGVAALWQRTPPHQRALAACHRRVPLAPIGWRADLDCLRFGANIGAACVASCWPLMVACAFAGHSLIAMAGGLAVGLAERWYYRPRTRTMLALTLALAMYCVALAGLGQRVAVAAPQTPTPVVEFVGSTTEPFTLGKHATRVTLLVHAPNNPVLLRAGPGGRRVFLNIEKMTSDEWSGPYDVYVNLPPHEKPGPHSKFYAGSLPMFGLVEASRADEKHEAQGLYQQLEITKMYARLVALPGWDSRQLRVTFIPRYLGNTIVRVDRITLSMALR